MTRATRRWRGRARRLVLATGLLLVASWLGAAPAQAHATLLATDPAEGAVLPASPDRLTLTFSEPVSPATSATRLFDARGEEVDAQVQAAGEDVTVEPAAGLADGTYVLAYRVISADGHPISGSLSFSVGAPSGTVVAPGAASGTDGTVAALQAAVQGVTYVALFLAAGLALFRAVVLPGAPTGGPGVPGLAARQRRSRAVARAAALVAFGGALLLVPVGVLHQQGLGLGGLAATAPWTGWLSTEGLVAAAVGAGLLLALGLPEDPARPLPAARRAALVAGAGVALASVALVGHTRSYGPTWLVLSSDVVHVLAAATWVGGLVGLVIVWPALVGREDAAGVVLGRFSALAGGLLALVAVAGVLLGWRILGSWAGLVSTGYGWVLLAKTALVAAVAAVAGWNRYRLLPRVRRSPQEERRGAAHRLRAAVRVEAGALVVVLLLTGVLVTRVPGVDGAPAAASAPSSTLTATAEGLRVVAHLEPGRVGTNTVHLQLQDASGEPLEPYAAPSVSVHSAGVDLGGRPVRNVASGTYVGEVVVPTPGTWELRVSVRLDEFTSPVLSLRTTVSSR